MSRSHRPATGLFATGGFAMLLALTLLIFTDLRPLSIVMGTSPKSPLQIAAEAVFERDARDFRTTLLNSDIVRMAVDNQRDSVARVLYRFDVLNCVYQERCMDSDDIDFMLYLK